MNTFSRLPNPSIMHQPCPKFYIQVLELIEQHYQCEQFSTFKLAQLVHLDRTQLYRKLIAEKNVSPSKLIQQFRLSKAQQLILNSDISLRDIAYQCGYGSYNRFSNVYKQYYKVSPSNARKQLKTGIHRK